jgi:very-short-patch-repair endonuclease
MASKRAQKLRRNPTKAELRLWKLLRRQQILGCRFRRQVPIGPYVADFACYSHRVIIEVDGGQHAMEADKDLQRTRWLESQKFRVLRFWNNDVLANPEGVRVVIERVLAEQNTPLPDSPPQGGRE